MDDQTVSVRYLVDDVAAALDFYTTHLGFEVGAAVSPVFADVTRGNLRVLLSGPGSSAGRADDRRRASGPGGLEPDPPQHRRHRR